MAYDNGQRTFTEQSVTVAETGVVFCRICGNQYGSTSSVCPEL